MPRDATPGTLSAKQRRAIDLLLTAVDLSAVARDVGVDRTTVYRWLRSEPFRNALQAAERDALGEISRGLTRLGRQAIATIARAMTDDHAGVGTRVRAADVTLTKLIAIRQHLDLEERLAAVEAAVGIDGRKP